MSFFVISAKSGIQHIQSVTKHLDPVPPFGWIQRGDGFSQMHQKRRMKTACRLSCKRQRRGQVCRWLLN